MSVHGELAGLGVKVAASPVWEILKTSGIDPAPRRTGPTWSQFLRSQAEAILACDFFTADLPGGTQAYILTVIGHAARRLRVLGITLHPTGEWTTQPARNLIMDLGGQAERVKFMIRDRGSNFTAAFDAVLAGAGIRTVLCNVRTPRMNAIAERWIRGCRRELLHRTLIWNHQLATNGATTFAAVNNLAAPLTVNGVAESSKAFQASIPKATGEMIAVNQDTGKIEWDTKLPSSPYGAAAVTNNVVFTTTYSGHLYAFNATTGTVLLNTPLSAGSSAPVTIDGDYVITGAAVPLSDKALIIAYKLGAKGKLPTTVH
jgi:PQQ-like domain